MWRSALLCLALGAEAFIPSRPSCRTTTIRAVSSWEGFVDAVANDPTTRFGVVAATVFAALTSKVSRSPLRRKKQEKPPSLNSTAWRENELAKWRLPGDGDDDVCVYFVREWARSVPKKQVIVQDIDRGVRIKFGATKIYLSAREERRLESVFEEHGLRKDLSGVPVADSIYTYPRRKTRTAAGGLDVISSAGTVTVARSSYAKNEPIKESTERQLLALLDRDLTVAYAAQKIIDDDDDDAADKKSP